MKRHVTEKPTYTLQHDVSFIYAKYNMSHVLTVQYRKKQIVTESEIMPNILFGEGSGRDSYITNTCLKREQLSKCSSNLNHKSTVNYCWQERPVVKIGNTAHKFLLCHT